jgi:hypothetical protein
MLLLRRRLLFVVDTEPDFDSESERERFPDEESVKSVASLILR